MRQHAKALRLYGYIGDGSLPHKAPPRLFREISICPSESIRLRKRSNGEDVEELALHQLWFHKRGNIGIMEKKMETTIVNSGKIGLMETNMETTIVNRGNIGLMKKKMAHLLILE